MTIDVRVWLFLSRVAHMSAHPGLWKTGSLGSDFWIEARGK
jgi:hypothetical protein